MARRSWLIVLSALTALLVAGCSDDGAGVRSASSSGSGSTSGSASGSGSSSESADCPSPPSGSGVVGVRLDEFSVRTEPSTVATGRIAFAVSNDGADIHELVIVKGSGVKALPRVTSTAPAEAGRVDEDALPTGDFVGEVHGIPAGDTCGGSFLLNAGTYVLFCNIVEIKNGTPENHLELGMVTTITVT